MKCRKCHAEIPDESKFCMVCGANQSIEKRKSLRRPNGTGTVYKLGGRRKRPWVAAKNKTIIGYYETKTTALEVLNRLAGRDIDERYNLSFKEVYECWKKEHFTNISEESKRSYEIAFKAFSPLHEKKFRLLRTTDYQKIIDDNRDKTAIVRKYRILINQLSEWAMREEIVSTNFAQFVQIPTQSKREKPVFTNSEIKLIQNDKSETARIVSMLLATGMRISELFNLPLSDYHGTYVIGGSKTKAGRNRIIPIRIEGREHFKYFAERSVENQKLLYGYSGNKNVNNFRRKDYHDLLERLGIDPNKNPHTTRHTYASRAVKEGIKPEMLQKILGHSDFSTTANVYTHIDVETLVSEVEKCCVTNTLLTNTK